jgi:hypothetical protein
MTSIISSSCHFLRFHSLELLGAKCVTPPHYLTLKYSCQQIDGPHAKILVYLNQGILMFKWRYLTLEVTDSLIYGGHERHLIRISVKIVRGGGLRVKGVRGWPQMAGARFTRGRASSCSQWPTSGAIGRHLKRQRRRRRSHSGGATFDRSSARPVAFFPFALLLFHDIFIIHQWTRRCCQPSTKIVDGSF